MDTAIFKKSKNNKGFTLVELILCIAIIAILAAVLVPTLTGYIRKSNLSRAKSNVKNAYTSISTYISNCEVAGKVYSTTGDDIIKEINDANVADLSDDYTIDFEGQLVSKVTYKKGNVSATLTVSSGDVALEYAGTPVDDNGDPKKTSTPAGN